MYPNMAATYKSSIELTAEKLAGVSLYMKFTYCRHFDSSIFGRLLSRTCLCRPGPVRKLLGRCSVDKSRCIERKQPQRTKREVRIEKPLWM